MPETRDEPRDVRDRTRQEPEPRFEEHRRVVKLWNMLTAIAVCGSYLLTMLALTILSWLQH